MHRNSALGTAAHRTGNTLAARTGAGTRDLMARTGHDSPQAAMIYQHATAEADRSIAGALHAAVEAERKKARRQARRTRRTRTRSLAGGSDKDQCDPAQRHANGMKHDRKRDGRRTSRCRQVGHSRGELSSETHDAGLLNRQGWAHEDRALVRR